MFRPNSNTYVDLHGKFNASLRISAIILHNQCSGFMSQVNKSELIWGNKIHEMLFFHTGSNADISMCHPLFVAEINHLFGSCFNLLNLSCTVIPMWISAFNHFLSEDCSSDKYSHCVKTEMLYHNKLTHKIYEKNKNLLSILAFCQIQHSVVCTQTCFMIYALNSAPHISINRQMQMVAPVIWRIKNKKKGGRTRTVKLQTYADSSCPQWP